MSEQIQSKLTQEEIELAIDMTRIAMYNAIKALSEMVSDEAIIKNLKTEVETFEIESYAQKDTSSDELFVLDTKIVGDIEAQTYIIISEKNAERIGKRLLPMSLQLQPEMREGVLLELDNILIAALVTKFSNLLNVSAHGHVPSAQKMSVEQVTELMKEKEESLSPPYAFKLNINTFKSRIEIKMLCYFNEQIVPILKEFNVEDSYVGKQKKETQEKSNKENDSVGGFIKKLFQK